MHQLVDSNVECDTGSERETRFGPARPVEESECDQAAGDRVSLVDKVLEPSQALRSTCRSDAQATLYETVGQLGKAVSKPEHGAQDQGVDLPIVERADGAQTWAATSRRGLATSRQRGERRHDDDSTPGLARSEHRLSAPLQTGVKGQREARKQACLEDQDLTQSCDKDWRHQP